MKKKRAHRTLFTDAAGTRERELRDHETFSRLVTCLGSDSAAERAIAASGLKVLADDNPSWRPAVEDVLRMAPDADKRPPRTWPS